MNKIKKFIAIFLVIALPFSANATIANSVGFGIATTGALGVMLGVATGVTIAATGGLALGVLGAAIYFAPDGTIPTASNSVLMVSLNPNNPNMKTPPGWTNPTTPPTTTDFSTVYQGINITQGGYFGSYATVQQACDATALTNTAGTFGAVGSHYIGYETANSIGCTDGTGTNRANFARKQIGCPTGYVQGISNCLLNQPTLVTKPVQNIQEIKRVGNTFVQDSQANPADIAPSEKVTITPLTVTANGLDGSKSVTTLNPDGTSSVVNTTPNPDGKTSKQVTANFGAPDANGNVPLIGKNDTTVSGQGVSVGGAVSTPLDISSLNKESTQANIKGNIQDIKDLMNNTAGHDTSLNDKKTDFDTASSAHDQKIIDIGSAGLDAHGTSWTWFPSIPSGTCSPYSFSLGGSSHTLDYCNGIEKARDVIGYIFYILTAYALFNILTGRREE